MGTDNKAYLGNIAVKVTIPNLEFENREMLREFRRQMRVAHTAGVREGRDILERVLYDKKAFDTGTLMDSVTTKLFVNTDDIFGGIIYFKEPGREYAYFVEHGRGKGYMPPKDIFTAWAHRHGIGSPRLIWWLRARIARKGTKGKKFMKQATREVQKNYSQIINKAVQQYRKSIK